MLPLLLVTLLAPTASAFDVLAIGDARFDNGWTLDGPQFSFALGKMDAMTEASDGFSVDVAFTTAAIDAAALDGYDVLWVSWVDDPPAAGAFTTAERDAIGAWVADGGIVVVGCDSLDHQAICNDFGVSTGGEDAINPMSVTSAGGAHPLFDGPYGVVSSFSGYGIQGWFVPVSGQTALATEANGRPVVLVQEVGWGAGVMLADIDFFNNVQLSDSTELTLTSGDIFLGNTLAWIHEFGLPVCGNTRVEDGEDCDDGNTSQTDDCLNDCVAATCGDGFTHAGQETCDDGNTDDTDACLSTCEPATCGDGFVYAAAEGCDGAGETADCDGDCTTAICGDGYVNTAAGEICDDANIRWGDTCSPTCLPDSDADGVTDIDEASQGLDPTNPDSDGDGAWDSVDPAPLDAGATGANGITPQTPDYGLGCASAPAPSWAWTLGLIGLLRRRR